MNFFRISNKAGLVLKDYIRTSCPTANQTRLLKFCETRWVEHLNSLILFWDVYEHICSALEDLDEGNMTSNVAKPHTLLVSIRTAQFIILLTVLKPIFSLTKNLSLFLQKQGCDLSRCVEYTNDLTQQIDYMRQNADKQFNNIFVTAKEKAEKVGVELMNPRRVKRQHNRENYEGGPEPYFRRSIFIPFLDHYSDQLKSRFLVHQDLLSKIQNILPEKCIELNANEIQSTVDIFEAEWPNDITGSTEDFVAEITMWRRSFIVIFKSVEFLTFCNVNLNSIVFFRYFLKRSKEGLPETFIDAINSCDTTLYPSVRRFLQIGATLPISVAPSERSFSSLRRLKTYLRAKTGENRLNGLALLNVHRDVEVSHDDILNIMSKQPRRMDILL